MTKKGVYAGVIFIGPDYLDHRGGIGAVLKSYSLFVTPFKFIPSFKAKNPVEKILVFCNCIFKLFVTLFYDRDIKVVHIHGSHGASVYRKFILIMISKFFFRKKVIYHLHSSSYDKLYENGNFFYRFICTKAISNSDLIITLSKKWYEYYNETFDVKSIKIVNNVVPEPIILHPTSSKSEVLEILFLGRIGIRKGVFDLLNVIITQKKSWMHKVRFYLGGDGDIDKLNNIICEHKLEELVEYIGWVDGERKVELLNKSDILILPSYNEGLPISILEAMSYSMPIIASNVGGIPEIVKNFENGVTLAPGDDIALAKAINFFINDPEKVRDYGKTSFQMVTKYMAHAVEKQLINCYNDLKR